jgi:hypothetical protein
MRKSTKPILSILGLKLISIFLNLFLSNENHLISYLLVFQSRVDKGIFISPLS